MNEAPCGFAAFADDGTLLSINRTLLTLLGYTHAELHGRHVQTMLSVGTRVFYQTHFFPLLRTQGHAYELYLSLRAKTGEEVPVLVNAVRRERDDGAVSECVFIAMHERSRYEDAILHARRAAEAATREKEAALAALIRTNERLETANIELEAQQEELRSHQADLLELHARMHAQLERESLLNRIHDTIRLKTDSDAILQTSVNLLAETLGADRCYFAEYDVPSNRARVSADWCRPDLPSLRGVYQISDFDLDIAEVYGPSGLLISPDIHNPKGEFSPKAAAALAALGMRSGVGVALFEGAVPVASLNVAMAETPRGWTAVEVELVQAVAALTRTAMQEARLHEREHRIAEQLQEALLPRLPEKVIGLDLDAYYRPALDEAEIGGDFYDVFSLEKGCHALVVADLSGKGLQAASQIATVRHMLRTVLYQPGITIAQAVTTLNAMLTEHELLAGFATLFVGAYDAGQRTLTYVNAGQESGLIHRKADLVTEEMEPTGPILGGFLGAAFHERTVSLLPGDVLALFTDGLTEAGTSRKDMLGVPGMVRIFQTSVSGGAAQEPSTAADITARVMREVEREATPAGIRDDVCLLVACVE